MPAKRTYTAYIPIAIMAINVLIFVPMGWIVNGTLNRIEELENNQSKIQLKYVTDKEYQADLQGLTDRLSTLDRRLYELSR